MERSLYYVVYMGSKEGSNQVTGCITLEPSAPIRSMSDINRMAGFISEQFKFDACIILSWTPLEFESIKLSVVTASCRCSECNLLLGDLIQLGSGTSPVYINFCPTCGSKLSWSKYLEKEDSAT